MGLFTTNNLLGDLMLENNLFAGGGLCAVVEGAVDASVVTTVTDTKNPGEYFQGVQYCQNPCDSDVILVLVSYGGHHEYAENKKIISYKSTDRGVTFGSMKTVYDPEGIEAHQGLCAGYDRYGKLHVFSSNITEHLVYVGNYYLYSDDDGDTWSEPVSVPYPPPAENGDEVNLLGAGGKLFISSMIENNGKLMATYYGGEVDIVTGVVTRYAYLYESIDYGDTWDWGSRIFTTLEGESKQNEVSIVALDDTTILAMIRPVSAPYQFKQHISLDNGVTWTALGDKELYSPALTSNPGTPVLKYFYIEGVRVIGFYHMDKNSFSPKLYVVYGTADDIKAHGLDGWNIATRFVIHEGTFGSVHFGNVGHVDNNLNSYAVYLKELSRPWDLTHNSLIWMDFQSTHYESLKADLGIT